MRSRKVTMSHVLTQPVSVGRGRRSSQIGCTAEWVQVSTVFEVEVVLSVSPPTTPSEYVTFAGDPQIVRGGVCCLVDRQSERLSFSVLPDGDEQPIQAHLPVDFNGRSVWMSVQIDRSSAPGVGMPLPYRICEAEPSALQTAVRDSRAC